MKTILTCALSIALFAGTLVAPAPAQTIDPSSYFMLTPGLWRIEAERVPGQPSSYRFGTVVSQLGKYILHNGFEQKGANWVVDDVGVFELTATALLYHGEQHPITQDYQVFNPPLRIPRAMKIGDAVHQRVTAITPAGSFPLSVTMMLTATGLTKTVKAGTYANCARFEFSFMADQFTEQSIEIRAPGQGTVWGLFAELDTTRPETGMGSVDITERVQ